jgi:hypothetical protein
LKVGGKLSNKKNNNYLKKAKRIFKFAKSELEIARKEKNILKAQQAAEKGYLCLLRTVDALLFRYVKEEEKLPKNERGRLYFLGKYADRDFRRKYNAIRHAFHIDAFHEGIINFKQLQEQFEDLGEILKRI